MKVRPSSRICCIGSLPAVMKGGIMAPNSTSIFGLEMMTMKPCRKKLPLGRARSTATARSPLDWNSLIASQTR